MALTEDQVQAIITGAFGLAGVLVGLRGQHVLSASQRRADTQRERLEALQQAAYDFGRAVQSLDSWREEPARWEANPPPAPVAAARPGEPAPGPWPFDRQGWRDRQIELLEPWAEASSRLRIITPRVRDEQARTLAEDLRAAGGRVMTDPVMPEVKRLVEALEARIGELLRNL